MPVSQAEANNLLPHVQPFFNLLVQRYDEGKYPPTVYAELLQVFQNPDTVQPDHIRRALKWKYGKLYATNLPESHAATIERITGRWQHFVQAGNNEERLEALRNPNEQNSDFVSRAFLVHLAAPNDVPIIDRFNHRAVRYLLSMVRPAFELGRLPSTYDDMLLIYSFVERLIAVWPNTPPNNTTVDRFLMMFGKNVAPPY